MSDPRLVNKLKTKFLLSPSTEPYNLESSDVDPSMGQATEVRRVLKDMVCNSQACQCFITVFIS